MPPLRDHLDACIERIYQAVDGTADWSSVLSTLGPPLGAFSAAMFTLGNDSSRHGEANMDTERMDSYIDHYCVQDLWWHGAERRRLANAGAVNTDAAFEPDTEKLLASEFYNDFLAPQDIRYLLSLSVAGRRTPEPSGTFLSLYRRHADEPFGPGEEAFLAALAPHFAAAFRLADRLAEVERSLDAATAGLDAATAGFIVLDRDLSIRCMNGTARDILAARPPALRAAGGRLAAPAGAARAQLDAALTRAGAAAWAGIMRAFPPFAVPRPPPERPLTVEVAACAPSCAAGGGTGAWHVLVTVIDPGRRPGPDPAAIAPALGLSPREAAVAASLGGGRTIVETAGSLGISEETARKYTKSIYQKTGLRNQAELVAAAWRVTR